MCKRHPSTNGKSVMSSNVHNHIQLFLAGKWRWIQTSEMVSASLITLFHLRDGVFVPFHIRFYDFGNMLLIKPSFIKTTCSRRSQTMTLFGVLQEVPPDTELWIVEHPLAELRTKLMTSGNVRITDGKHQAHLLQDWTRTRSEYTLCL